MYGFHKVPHLQEDNIWEFKHSHFLKDQPDLLAQIRRKTAKAEDQAEGSPSTPPPCPGGESASGLEESPTQLPSSISAEISTIKMQQETIFNALKDLQTENKHLWTETVATRQRFEQQQETINKILHFLASLFSGTGIGVGTSATTAPNVPAAGSFLMDTRKIPSHHHSPSSGEVGDTSSVIGRVPSGKRQMLLESCAEKEESLCEDIDLLKDSIEMLSEDLGGVGWREPELDLLFQPTQKLESEPGADDVVDLFLNV
jgi:hypothetical protein